MQVFRDVCAEHSGKLPKSVLELFSGSGEHRRAYNSLGHTAEWVGVDLFVSRDLGGDIQQNCATPFMVNVKRIYPNFKPEVVLLGFRSIETTVVDSDNPDIISRRSIVNLLKNCREANTPVVLDISGDEYATGGVSAITDAEQLYIPAFHPLRSILGLNPSEQAGLYYSCEAEYEPLTAMTYITFNSMYVIQGGTRVDIIAPRMQFRFWRAAEVWGMAQEAGFTSCTPYSTGDSGSPRNVTGLMSSKSDSFYPNILIVE